MPKKSKGMTKQAKMQTAIFAGLLIIIVGGGFFLGRSLGWWGATTTTTLTSDEFEFYAEWLKLGTEVENDDHSISMYRLDISEMDEDEKDDAREDFSQYSLDTSSLDSGDNYDPDYDEYEYYAVVNGSDITEYWFIPQTGTLDSDGANNHLYLTNMTEDVAMGMMSVDELDTAFDSNTSTNYYDEWEVSYGCLDGAEGTGTIDNTQGYMSYYDFEDDEWHTVVIRIGFNVSAELSYCDFDSDFSYSEKVSGNYLYYEIQAGIFGTGSFLIDLGSAHGTTFTTMNCSIGYGTAESMTVWDTYTS